MLDLSVFVLPSKERKKRPLSMTLDNDIYVNGVTSIQNEIEEYGINAEVKGVSYNDVPLSVKSNLVLFIDQDTYVQADFVNTIVSLNNLFRDAGVFCGPVHTDMPNSYEASFHTYNLEFGDSEVAKISSNPNTFPSINGCVITGNCYNQFNFQPSKGPRKSTINNNAFLMRCSSKSDIYYAKKLAKVRFLDKTDFLLDNLSDYYYDLGYSDGLVLSAKNRDEKNTALYERFVKAPEMLDIEMPRWLFKNGNDKQVSNAKDLILMKCKYQIGFYEGMLGEAVI